MKKLKPSTPSPKAGGATPNLGPLIDQVRSLVQSARRVAAASINTLQVLTNFEIGRLIVEHEQAGAPRAAYGEKTLKLLASSLTTELGRGYSERNLEYMRKFYLAWKDRAAQISQKASANFPTATTMQASSQLPTLHQKPATSPGLFALSWSHYVFLLGVRDENERRFYEIEAARGSWSLPDLKRQFNSGLYERLALSGDKKRVRRLAQEGHTLSRPADLLKDPYVLEFEETRRPRRDHPPTGCQYLCFRVPALPAIQRGSVRAASGVDPHGCRDRGLCR